METKVAGILGALSQLEQDLDSLESSVSDMKKSIINHHFGLSHPTRRLNQYLSKCAKCILQRHFYR